jgi:orotidine-5'-phosphate decarboxylase
MSDKIILSADELGADAVVALTEAIGSKVYAVKIHDVYDALGPSMVEKLKTAGAQRVWMDAKIHDIPNTARARARAYANNGIDIITVHASGGVEMMRAAKEGAPNVEVFAVTVLTSLAEADAEQIYHAKISDQVLSLAKLAKEAGMDGVVCSARELEILAKEPTLSGMKFVVPGIRSAGKDTQDQKRTATPADAIRGGASHLVIGRQITQSAVAAAALAAIEREIA